MSAVLNMLSSPASSTPGRSESITGSSDMSLTQLFVFSYRVVTATITKSLVRREPSTTEFLDIEYMICLFVGEFMTRRVLYQRKQNLSQTTKPILRRKLCGTNYLRAVY